MIIVVMAFAALALGLISEATGWEWPIWVAIALVGLVCTFADSML